MKILALDFEGTSREPRRGYPAQIGIAVMEGETVLAQDEWLMRQPRHYKTNQPTKEIDANSLAVWGMTLDRLESEGISIKDGCERLRTFIEANAAQWLPVLAFQFTYDAECYGAMLFEGGYYEKGDYRRRTEGRYIPFPEILGPRWVDVFRMARLKLALNTYKLDDVAEYFGLARETEAHGALMDAILAGQIYARLSLAAAEKVSA